MFWSGKVSLFSNLSAYFHGKELSLAGDLESPAMGKQRGSNWQISMGSKEDAAGVVKLLNMYFEQAESTTVTDVSEEWFRDSFLEHGAIWVVAKDPGGTIRGCASSFRCPVPYPNALEGCSVSNIWGIKDWYCVEPLWRSKGVGHALLNTLDYMDYRVGRKAHVFLKVGYPLPLPNIPVYCTHMYYRRAGRNYGKPPYRILQKIRTFPCHSKDRESGLVHLRVTGLREKCLHGAVISEDAINEWEDSLDALPECIVFVSGEAKHAINFGRGWKQSSLVSLYAFRWIPGKWLGVAPNSEII